MTFRIGDQVEVLGEESEGLKDSWSEGIIIGSNSLQHKVEYSHFVEDDGTQTVEDVQPGRLRPRLRDDSYAIPLERRRCGDAVDVWYKDCWWMGYVYETWDECISVEFLGNEEPPYIIHPRGQWIVRPGEEAPLHIRTSKHWNQETSKWEPKQPQLIEGWTDFRGQKGRPAQQSFQGDTLSSSRGTGTTDDSDSGAVVQNSIPYLEPAALLSAPSIADATGPGLSETQDEGGSFGGLVDYKSSSGPNSSADRASSQRKSIALSQSRQVRASPVNGHPKAVERKSTMARPNVSIANGLKPPTRPVKEAKDISPGGKSTHPAKTQVAESSAHLKGPTKVGANGRAAPGLSSGQTQSVQAGKLRPAHSTCTGKAALEAPMKLKPAVRIKALGAKQIKSRPPPENGLVGKTGLVKQKVNVASKQGRDDQKNKTSQPVRVPETRNQPSATANPSRKGSGDALVPPAAPRRAGSGGTEAVKHRAQEKAWQDASDVKDEQKLWKVYSDNKHSLTRRVLKEVVPHRDKAYILNFVISHPEVRAAVEESKRKREEAKKDKANVEALQSQSATNLDQKLSQKTSLGKEVANGEREAEKVALQAAERLDAALQRRGSASNVERRKLPEQKSTNLGVSNSNAVHHQPQLERRTTAEERPSGRSRVANAVEDGPSKGKIRSAEERHSVPQNAHKGSRLTESKPLVVSKESAKPAEGKILTASTERKDPNQPKLAERLSLPASLEKASLSTEPGVHRPSLGRGGMLPPESAFAQKEEQKAHQAGDDTWLVRKVSAVTNIGGLQPSQLQLAPLSLHTSSKDLPSALDWRINQRKQQSEQSARSEAVLNALQLERKQSQQAAIARRSSQALAGPQALKPTVPSMQAEAVVVVPAVPPFPEEQPPIPGLEVEANCHEASLPNTTGNSDLAAAGEDSPGFVPPLPPSDEEDEGELPPLPPEDPPDILVPKIEPSPPGTKSELQPQSSGGQGSIELLPAFLQSLPSLKSEERKGDSSAPLPADSFGSPPPMVAEDTSVVPSLAVPLPLDTAAPTKVPLQTTDRSEADSNVHRLQQSLHLGNAPSQPLSSKAQQRADTQLSRAQDVADLMKFKAVRLPAPQEPGQAKKRKRSLLLWESRMGKRLRKPVSAEEATCTYICLDNLGGGITRAQLQHCLASLSIDGIKEVDVVSVDLSNGDIYDAGWGCIEFSTHQDAKSALKRLEGLYMLTDRSPFPRPIICHWPRRWPSHPSASDGMMGHVKGLLVSPHFCQPNSIEFDDALKWRLFRAQEGLLRQELREDHVLQLVEVLRWGCKKLGVPGKMTRPPPQPDKQSSVLWLRGLSARCSEESLGASFEQWGGRVVRTLVDPISYVRNGQALIALGQYEKAVNVTDDIGTMVFIIGDGPRPIEADVARPGKPRGSQSVYNKAMWEVLHTDDSVPLSDPKLVLIEKPQTIQERVSARLKRLMYLQMICRQGLAKSVAAKAEQLGLEVERHIDVEFRKLVQLVEMMETSVGRKVREMNRLRRVTRLQLPPRYLELCPPRQSLIYMAEDSREPRGVVYKLAIPKEEPQLETKTSLPKANTLPLPSTTQQPPKQGTGPELATRAAPAAAAPSRPVMTMGRAQPPANQQQQHPHRHRGHQRGARHDGRHRGRHNARGRGRNNGRHHSHTPQGNYYLPYRGRQ